MVIAVNLSYAINYERLIINELLHAAEAYQDLRFWFPRIDLIDQVVPPTIDAIVGTLKPLSFSGADQAKALVNINSYSHPRAVQVCPDNDAVTKMALAHFEKQKLLHFAFVYTPQFPPSIFRLEAFRRVCRRRGICAHVLECRKYAGPTSKDRMFVEALKLLPKPAGILLPTDMYGRAMMEACRDLGFEVPGDISIVGVDDLPKYCLACQPTLSSIRIDTERIAATALSAAVSIIQGQRVEPIQLIAPIEIVQRESTGTARAYSSDITRILSFIHNGFQDQIQMADLVEEQSLGRRALEVGFRAELGESPMAYLRNVRFQQAEFLLKTTELKVEEVASRCGIPDTCYFCRKFRARYGISPRKYRVQFRVAKD